MNQELEAAPYWLLPATSRKQPSAQTDTEGADTTGESRTAGTSTKIINLLTSYGTLADVSGNHLNTKQYYGTRYSRRNR